MSDLTVDNINQLPFKLRFTSTQKLCKEITKMISDKYEMLDKLIREYDTIGGHKDILGNIKANLEVCNESLKQLRFLCQCQSDDDKTAITKQLAISEDSLDKLKKKCNDLQTIKCIDISVKRLPSNWRAAMLKIARDKAKKAFNDNVVALHKPDDNTEANDQNIDRNNEENNDIKTEDNDKSQEMDENMINSEAMEIKNQFEMDLERKIYETQVEELLQMVQSLVMQIKTSRARIDISKQLIKVVLKMKREYESSNSKLKESLATCHCAEAGADDDIEFQKRMENKKQLEETVDSVSNELKYWEEQYVILKEGKTKSDNNIIEAKVETNPNNNITTVCEVANEEEVAHVYSAPMPSTSQQQSCMFAGQSVHSLPQGTANPAVIYLEGLVAHQQPTYIPASNIHQPVSLYPHTYTIGGHPHHPYHTAPDGSIQVFSSDIASQHPSYIAYQ